MSYEINILAINQIEPVHIPFGSSICVCNELENESVGRYAEIWPFFSSTKGILYSLVTEVKEGFYSALEICDSDFDMVIPGNLLPMNVSKQIRDNITAFFIKDAYKDEFASILKFLIRLAPDKRILFQTRYQGGDTEIVIGVLNVDDFLILLEQKQIYFNLCYIIEDC